MRALWTLLHMQLMIYTISPRWVPLQGSRPDPLCWKSSECMMATVLPAVAMGGRCGSIASAWQGGRTSLAQS